MAENAKRRVVIIDDSLNARDELKYLIKTYHPDLEVLGDFEDTVSARGLIEAGQVEGVFLDINFAEQGETLGLEFANSISQLPNEPWIIFVTGYPEHALEAIPIRPFCFITKPIDELKLAGAVDKVRNVFPVYIPPPTTIIIIRYHIIKEVNGKTVTEIMTRYLVPKEIRYVQTNQGVDTVKVYLVNGEVLNHVTLRLNKWLYYNLPSLKNMETER